MGQNEDFWIINLNDDFFYCIDCVYGLALVLSSAFGLAFHFLTMNRESSTT